MQYWHQFKHCHYRRVLPLLHSIPRRHPPPKPNGILPARENPSNAVCQGKSGWHADQILQTVSGLYMRKGLYRNTNRSLVHFIQKELLSSDPYRVKHHRLAELLNISMLSTVHWHFAGNMSGNVCFGFPVFTHCYLKPPMCELANITLSLQKEMLNKPRN